MNYQPFFNMKVLLEDSVVNQVAMVAGLLILCHVLFAVYFIYKTISNFKKSSLRMTAKGI